MSDRAGPGSALLGALYRGDQAALDALLAEEPELDVLEAAAVGRVGRLRELLDADADGASERSPDGFTALHYAAFFGQPEAVVLLLERGADCGAVADNSMRVQPLHSAAAADETAIALMLLDAGADPDARQEGGFTAIHAAAQNGNAELAELLLERGADPSLLADDGRDAVAFARSSGHAELAEQLALGSQL